MVDVLCKTDTGAPCISVLVPVFNVERFLPQCLDSLTAQTISSIEFICVDDGSTDKCPSILDQYASTDNRFKVIHVPNGGYGAAMNRALSLAGGKYIGILESDDWAEPSTFQELYNLAEAHDWPDIVKANHYRHLANGSLTTSDYYPSNLCTTPTKLVDARGLATNEARIVIRPPATIWSGIYRRNFLLEHEISFLESPGASYQDIGFSLKALCMASVIMLTNKSYVHYRVDNEGSSSVSNDKAFCVIEEFSELDRYLNETIERLSRKAALSELLADKRLRAYWWNATRVAPPARNEFVYSARIELLALTELGYLNVTSLSPSMARRLDKWLHSPEQLLLDLKIRDARNKGSRAMALKIRRRLLKFSNSIKRDNSRCKHKLP